MVETVTSGSTSYARTRVMIVFGAFDLVRGEASQLEGVFA